LLLLIHSARGHSDALKARRGGNKRTKAQKRQKDSKRQGLKVYFLPVLHRNGRVCAQHAGFHDTIPEKKKRPKNF